MGYSQEEAQEYLERRAAVALAGASAQKMKLGGLDDALVVADAQLLKKLYGTYDELLPSAGAHPPQALHPLFESGEALARQILEREQRLFEGIAGELSECGHINPIRLAGLYRMLRSRSR